jgi:membrane associated rhomboid family serine protease
MTGSRNLGAMVAATPTPGRLPARPVRIFPPRPIRAAVTMASLTGLLYVSEGIDQAMGGKLDADGIVPRQLGGLGGVLWAPLLHAGWPHLIANTVPFLVFGYLVMANGVGQFAAVTATIWLLGGLGVWLTGPDNVSTVGASGVIFGWLVFLLARGFFNRSVKQIALAVPLFLIWGSVLLGVLPGQPNISWQGHLFGALAGLLAARLVARADARR